MRPLHFLSNIQTRVQDELVQVSHLFGEAGLAIAALLRGAELVLEQGVVLGANNGKIIAHRAAVPPHIGRGFCARRGRGVGSSLIAMLEIHIRYRLVGSWI
jgi:hypothetical protein